VYVVDAQNLVQYREVTLGANHEGHRVVLSGLAAGDHVVVNGTSHIAAPNTPVNPVALPADQVVSR
jgi:multidrug efflux system membrane fusion protein